MANKNYNKNITTKVFKKEDLYDGIFVQSFGNSSYIYQMLIINGDYFYQPTHKINKVDGSLLNITIRDNPSNGKPQKIRFFGEDQDGYIEWCETVWTRKLNTDVRREDILNNLGI